MARIKVKNAKEIELIRDAGALAAETLIRAGEMCKPGINTLEIDEFIGDYTRKHKGISACKGYHGYPRYACISINEVVCHGIPNANTILKDGDIVNIDITTILQGYHGDTSAMFCVGKVSKLAKDLVDTAKFCMEEGIRAAGEVGARYWDIGNAIQDIADENGFSVVEDYCGHGIGRGFHEEPTIFHFRNNALKQFIEVGNVFTVEPMINAGRPGTKTLRDGWTAVTSDGSLSAQWEHTIVRTKDGIEILTLPR
ncbi:MAG: type I methionyl aminopeptidase [Fibrobacteraceae bacterium]|nr:type I methionyl aminopeptidase [Fibrobacteraceae bacterium]MCF0216597.1 type I methionyl aminopeptidase [Fibrobacteraceae bacterium]